MEITPFLWSLVWNILVSIWILIVIFIIKWIKNKLSFYLEYITALTVWLLLWIIFLGFLPELIESWTKWSSIWLFILIWVFLFYILELFLHWHHCKDLPNNSTCNHEHTNWLLMFWWTMFHNIFHGVILFSAFIIDFHFWVATTFAVLLHSIPQNIVNYVMNHNNPKYSYIASFWGVVWAILTYPFASFLIENKFYVLSIITWWLLYTALSDIFPEFKWKWTIIKKAYYLVFIVMWVILFLGFKSISDREHWREDLNHNENLIEDYENIKDNH